jgi:hypothetical protein
LRGELKVVSRFAIVVESLYGGAEPIQTGDEDQATAVVATDGDAAPTTATSWIAIHTVDALGDPVRGLRYRITLPDGNAREGKLDDRGLARIDGIAAGTCTISFPDLDSGDWGDGRETPQDGDKTVPPPMSDSDAETAATFRLRLHDPFANPIASGRYKVTIGNQTVEKQADGDGWTEEIESNGAETCRLEWGHPEDEEYAYAMDVRIAAAENEEDTWMLHHLGSPQEGDERENVLGFQRDYGLQATGELDEPTKAKLHELHESCELKIARSPKETLMAPGPNSTA